MRIDGARPSDRDRLYEICLRTGAAGQDATALYPHGELLGDVFLGAYLALEPTLAFVLRGEDGEAGGYIVATADTTMFSARCEREWWPQLRHQYRGTDFAETERGLASWIEQPPAPPAFVDEYPAHLHIDLLPDHQSGGWGRRLIERELEALRAAGSSGVHLGVATDNIRAVGFYQHLGFEELGADGVVWLGMRLT